MFNQQKEKPDTNNASAKDYLTDEFKMMLAEVILEELEKIKAPSSAANPK